MNDKIISDEIATSTPIHSSFMESQHYKLMEIDSCQQQQQQHQPNQQPLRTNQRMVSSLLYMGQILNKTKIDSDNDFLVNGLETLTSLMDNVYLITKFGIGTNSKWLSRVGKNASKVWFVTLLLSIRKIIKDMIRLFKLKRQVWEQIKLCRSEQYRNHLAKLILVKYETKINEIQGEIFGNVLELIGSLNDLFFVSIEVFKLRVPRWIEKFIGFISAVMMIYRMSKKS